MVNYVFVNLIVVIINNLIIEGNNKFDSILRSLSTVLKLFEA